MIDSGETVVHHYFSPLIGGLEIQSLNDGIRSVSYVPTSGDPIDASGHQVIDLVCEELDRYFTGEPVSFTTPVSISFGTGFQRRVWAELMRIPYGEVRSYADIARALGDPKAARAVGSANGKNRIPIIIPCHRVINADGRLGGYASGLEIKRKLLRLEGVLPAHDAA